MKEETTRQKFGLRSLTLHKILMVLIVIVIVLFVVFHTGGSKNVYLHLIYLPIIMSAYFWGVKGAVIVAIISGVLAGPLMPLDVPRGIMQSTTNWVSRIIILTIIGFFTGSLFEKINKLSYETKIKDLTNPLTGLYNTRKLLSDLEEKIESGEKFRAITIKLTDMEGIEKYVNQDLVKIITYNIINDLKHESGRHEIYTLNDDEFFSFDYKDCNYLEKIKEIIDKYSIGLKVDDYNVRISIKAGFYDYKGSNETPDEIINKARIAREQGYENQSGIYYYSYELEEKRKENYEIAGALHDALKNKEFYLVYQPMIDIINNTISGSEILIRWDRGERTPIGPGQFIEIAEETGLIKEISRFVLENASSRIAEWRKKGIKTNFAFNINGKELIDDEFNYWAGSVIDQKRLDRSFLEIEITERTVTNNNTKLIETIRKLREKGYTIAIDDFGTGYNTLKSVGEIPFDLLKIDKYFIDLLDRLEIREIVRSIINCSHGLNKFVVAEGVETKVQLDYLKEVKCDFAQGYYFSKPLLPQDFEAYYRDFSNSD